LHLSADLILVDLKIGEIDAFRRSKAFLEGGAMENLHADVLHSLFDIAIDYRGHSWPLLLKSPVSSDSLLCLVIERGAECP